MHIKGLQKTTLLDFPDRVACTVFTGGCNFRCPFCHNASLVLSPSIVTEIPMEEFFSFIKKRKGILDGVCITGGEPLLQHGIIPFIERIKAEGYDVKLDTNGSFPEKLKDIVSRKLVDYIAMDIKNCEAKYPLTAGIEGDCADIFRSIDFIMSCGVDYEFRTTVVKELHTLEDIESIAHRINGARAYFLQNFKDSGDLICPDCSPHSEETMKKMLDIIKPHVGTCGLRGI